MQLAALATETLIAQCGVQRITQSGTALQQIAEHAEGAGSQVTPEQQAGFWMWQVQIQLAPEGLLDAERDARVGVGQVLVCQATGSEQRLTLEAKAAGCMQHRLGQAGADRGLRGFVKGVGHWPILPNAGNGR